MKYVTLLIQINTYLDYCTVRLDPYPSLPPRVEGAKEMETKPFPLGGNGKGGEYNKTGNGKGGLIKQMHYKP